MKSASVLRNLLLCCGIFGAGVLVVAYLTWPYGWDQGIYAWTGQVIRGGGRPYIDAWDMKGPAVQYLTALGQLLTGATPMGLRAFDLILLAGAAAVVWGLAGKRDRNDVTRLIPPLLFLLWYFSLGYWHTAQPDGWISWLIAGGVLASARASRRSLALVFAGGIVGVAFLMKQPYALFGIPVLAAIVGRRTGRRTTLWEVALAGLSAAVVVVGVLLYLRSAGIFSALWDAHFQYAIEYSQARGPRIRSIAIGFVRLFSTTEVIPALTPFALVGWHDLTRRDRPSAMTFAVWVATAGTLILLQGRLYDYHMLLLLPPLSLLGGLGIARCWQEFRTPSLGRTTVTGSLLSAVLVGLLVIQTLPFIVLEVGRWASWTAGRISRQEYLDGFGAPGAEYRTAEFLKRCSAADDHILIWGTNTGVLALTERPSFTRFGYNLALLSRSSPSVDRYQAEFQSKFQAERPRFIVLGEPHGDIADLPPQPLDTWMRNIIDTEYSLELDAGRLRTYRRRGKPETVESPESAGCNALDRN